MFAAQSPLIYHVPMWDMLRSEPEDSHYPKDGFRLHRSSDEEKPMAIMWR